MRDDAGAGDELLLPDEGPTPTADEDMEEKVCSGSAVRVPVLSRARHSCPTLFASHGPCSPNTSARGTWEGVAGWLVGPLTRACSIIGTRATQIAMGAVPMVECPVRGVEIVCTATLFLVGH